MANMLFANNCNTTLASSLTSGATSMSVTSATGFPSPTGVQYFYCTLADAATQTTIEIVKVTSVTGTTFAITRAQDGTSATAFAAGAIVSLRLVRASLNDFPKLDETNTFNADQAISGQLTSSAGLATTGTFTATAPSDGLVMDYATGFGRFSAFAGDGFQWYNAGIANTKLMQLSSSGVITTATWNGATVGVAYGGTGLTTLTAGYIPYGNGTGAFSSSSNLYFSGTQLGIGTSSPAQIIHAAYAGTAYLEIQNTSNSIIGYFGADTTGQVIQSGGNYPIKFLPNGSETARLDTYGNLLVGTTTAPAGSANIVGTKLWGSQTVSAGIYSSNIPVVSISAKVGQTSLTFTVSMNQAFSGWEPAHFKLYATSTANTLTGNGTAYYVYNITHYNGGLASSVVSSTGATGNFTISLSTSGTNPFTMTVTVATTSGNYLAADIEVTSYSGINSIT